MVEMKQPERQQAREIIMRYGWNAMAYQILNPSLRLWFTHARDAVVGYADAGGYWVVAGAPIGPAERLVAVADEFAAAAHAAKRKVCYFGAQQRILDMLAVRQPASKLLLGAQPVWQPLQWDAIIRKKSSLRAQLARARNKGVRVVQWDSAQATNHPALHRCLRDWLSTRGMPPMQFLVDPNTLANLADRMVLVAEYDEHVIGFLIASPVPARNGWLVEQTVRGNDAPNGTAELLIDTLMRAAAEQGADYVTLGLSPLSQAATIPEPPHSLLIGLLITWLRAHGRRFYNFEGLDRYKAKFQPAYWEPIYALSFERRTSLQTLYAIAEAFGGAPPPLFIGRAIVRSAMQELRWAAGRLRRRMQKLRADKMAREAVLPRAPL